MPTSPELNRGARGDEAYILNMENLEKLNREEEGEKRKTFEKERAQKQEKESRELISEMNDKLLDYNEMVKELKKRELFDGQIERTKAKYGEVLDVADFLTPKDWEIMTVLELFDCNTLKHSIGAFFIAKQKIDKYPQIEKRFEEEGVKMEQLYRSCLLHDIGKISVPKFILDNKLRDNEWGERLLGMIKEDADWEKKIPEKYRNDKEVLEQLKQAKDAEEIVEKLKDYNLRPVRLVPVKNGLRAEEIAKLEKMGISSDSTLMDIIARHEKASQDILKNQGLEVEAELAGHHHAPSKEKEIESILTIANRVSNREEMEKVISGWLHLADVREAMLSAKRGYKSSESKISTLGAFVRDAKEGLVNPAMVRLWIKDDLGQMKSDSKFKEIEALLDVPDKDIKDAKSLVGKHDLEKIYKFLKETV